MVTLVPLAEPLCRASTHLPPRPRYMVWVPPPPEVGVGVGVAVTGCGAQFRVADRLTGVVLTFCWVMVTDTTHESGSGNGSTRVDPDGVVAPVPPALVSVSPPSVHWARQLLVTATFPPAVESTL